MKILACVGHSHEGRKSGASYEYLSFVEILRLMGHQVEHFDYPRLAAASGPAMNDTFLETIESRGFDLVIVVTHSDEFVPEVLTEAGRHAAIMAWNCDDDWRWDTYSSRWAPHYTYAVTTYRGVYEANRSSHPNLLLSQWGCTGLSDGLATEVDFDISFVGRCYGVRQEHVRWLRENLGLAAFGQDIPPVGLWERARHRVRSLVGDTSPGLAFELSDQAAVKSVWNRSRISYTPLEASTGEGLQIKGRVFDMGLSGTLLACNRNPALDEFYDRDKEYIDFESLAEFVDKARYYLRKESERQAIASAYYRRTRKEHLWKHRFDALFKNAGLL